MLRQIVRRGFCVSNKDPIHVRNAENDHYRGFFGKFNDTSDTQIKQNFQKLFHDKVYLDQCEVIHSFNILLYIDRN